MGLQLRGDLLIPGGYPAIEGCIRGKSKTIKQSLTWRATSAPSTCMHLHSWYVETLPQSLQWGILDDPISARMATSILLLIGTWHFGPAILKQVALLYSYICQNVQPVAIRLEIINKTPLPLLVPRLWIKILETNGLIVTLWSTNYSNKDKSPS